MRHLASPVHVMQCQTSIKFAASYSAAELQNLALQARAAQDVAAREDEGASMGLGADGTGICETCCGNGEDACFEVLVWR